LALITIVRHGQAMFGAAEYDRLSPLGIEQSRCAGRYLADRVGKFDLALVGPRVRHAGTFEEMTRSGLASIDVKIEPAVDEFANGDAIFRSAVQRRKEGGELWPTEPRSQARLYSDEIRRWWVGEAVGETAGESAEGFDARTGAWLEGMRSAHQERDKILVVTSAGLIASIVCHALGASRSHAFDVMMSIRNGSITTLSAKKARLKLHSFNETAHLEKALVTGI
jgi:broad specificity phosphatase PhoE